MAKFVLYVILITVLCNLVDLRQVDFDEIFGGNNNRQVTRQLQATTTTTAAPQFANCLSNCLQYVTPQYSPVCGSNGQTYINQGNLNCAQRCGLNVRYVSTGSCDPTPGGSLKEVLQI